MVAVILRIFLGINWPNLHVHFKQAHSPVYSVLSTFLCFSLQLSFSSNVCSVSNSWRTRNHWHSFMVGDTDKNYAPSCLKCTCKFGQLIPRKILKIMKLCQWFLVLQEFGTLQTSLLKDNWRLKQRNSTPSTQVNEIGIESSPIWLGEKLL